MKIYDRDGREKIIRFDRFYENDKNIYFLIYRIYDSKFYKSGYETEIMVEQDEKLMDVLYYYGYSEERR